MFSGIAGIAMVFLVRQKVCIDLTSTWNFDNNAQRSMNTEYIYILKSNVAVSKLTKKYMARHRAWSRYYEKHVFWILQWPNTFFGKHSFSSTLHSRALERVMEGKLCYSESISVSNFFMTMLNISRKFGRAKNICIYTYIDYRWIEWQAMRWQNNNYANEYDGHSYYTEYLYTFRCNEFSRWMLM